MGKQRRRKNGKNGKNGKKGKNAVIAETDKGTCKSTSSSPLINKIRHGDVRIRHGALSGLSATTFSPESLSKNKNIKQELIQAMAERIMDDDVPCALCAVGCIANYILFQEQSKNIASSIDGNKLEMILSPVLFTKMNKACGEIKSIHEKMVHFVSTKLTSDNDSKATTTQTKEKEKEKNQTLQLKDNILKQLGKNARMLMDQFSIISLSLHAFCGLVEIFSVNNSSSSLLHHQRDQFISTIINSIVISNEMIRSLTTATISSNESSDMDPTTIVNKMIANHENETSIISDVAVYAARTMHSSSDDNLEFNKVLVSSGNFLDVITSSIQNTSLPTLARLHSAGTIITLRQQIMDLVDHDSSAAKLQPNIDTIVTTQIFPLLSSCTTYSADISSALCQQVSIVECKLQEEKEDEEIEKDVIKIVGNKKESARLIAKRQKEIKAAAKAKVKAEEEKPKIDHGNTMEEDGNDDEMKPDNEKTTPEETEDKYDRSVTAWKNACLPLKLSIEIIANLCADKTSEDHNDVFDDLEDDEMGWDSDQEEKLLSSSTKDFAKNKQEDAELFKKIMSCGIPDRVLSVFGSVFLSLLSSKSDQIPRVALEDMFEVLEKCGICLGNIVCNLSDWKSNETEISTVWKEFFKCLTSASDGKATYANLVLPCQAISPLLNTMGAFLKFRSTLGKNVNEENLNLILSYVCLEAPLNKRQSTIQSDRDEMQAIADIQKDSISFLGSLCSEPHPDVINEQICTVFLTLLNRTHSVSAGLMSEILNVLMDMYSADEGDPNNHEIIFRKMNILSVFEKSIPSLKHKIKEESDQNPMDTAFWQETALNAMRFIKYKKG